MEGTDLDPYRLQDLHEARESGKHLLYDREDGLSHCKVCGGAESSLPKDCPGRKLTDEEESKISHGTLDYYSGHWVEISKKWFEYWGV